MGLLVLYQLPQVTEQRLVELSLTQPGDDDTKLSARKRRFEEDRTHRKRAG